MTTTRVETTTPAARWRLAGFVCAIALGILGMHALALSCSGTDHSAMGMTASAGGASSHADHANAADDRDASSSTEHPATPRAATGDPVGGGQIMALCVALVVSSALAWAALSAIARRRGWTLPRGHVVARAFVLKVRYRPPLSRAQLSILRC